MQYLNNTLAISRPELLMFFPERTITSWQLDVVKKGGGSQNTTLYAYESIPTHKREIIESKLGKPETIAVAQTFTDRISSDAKAVEFYSNYKLNDGRHLPEKTQREYAINAAILNAIKVILADASESRKRLGGNLKGFWAKALTAVNNIRTDKQHTLPANERALQRTFEAYVGKKTKANGTTGYEALISGKFCNDNSRKVTDNIERLIMSLYAMPNKPFSMGVHALYQEFLNGKIEVVDRKTGEVFNVEDFMKDGKPIEISHATVWSYLNQPENRVIVDKVRSGNFNFNNEHRPHHHRLAPSYSLSKITLDDRDLPRKCVNGKRVKAYYAYDVASGCVIGRAYSMAKDEALFLDCMQDMFRLIDREGFGMPAEIEVENHLVNKFFDDLAVMFPFMRICNPGNSQEKHAEHLNRQKKYSVEKATQTGIGRWWSKHEAYRVDQDKVNDEFVEKTYTYEQLVADDLKACADFNNQLHPRQKKYPNKTRWQVLVENLNNNLAQVNKAVVYKSIGEHTNTTINRNQYVTVQYGKYQLPNPTVLQKLQPNNYNVDAFYLPDADGMIGEVYLYQNGVYVCKCEKIVEYNTARAERTDADEIAYTNQAKYVSAFDKLSKEGKEELAAPVIMKKDAMNAAVATEFEVVKEKVIQEPEIIEHNNDDLMDWAKQAIDNL